MSETPRFGDLPYRPDIDGLRAVAVSAVVAYHAFPAWCPGGFVGVDIFFVISGYLISTIIVSAIRGGRFSFADFYARRIRRIFPALALVLFASLVVGWRILLSDQYAQLGRHVAGGAAFLSNFVLYSESGYFDRSAELKPMLHLWSLAIEEQFYALWPLALVLAGASRRRTALLVGGIGAASFAANLYLVGHDRIAAFYWPVARFWELMIGGALALTALSQPEASPRGAQVYSLAGAAALAGSLLTINTHRDFPGVWALLPTAGAALLIAAGPSGWVNRALLSSRPMVWIGLISYPLYLWHWPVLTFARILDVSGPREVRMLLVAASVLLAWLTYRFVEAPIRHARSTAGLVTVMAGLLLCGVLVTSGAVRNRSMYYEIPLTEAQIQAERARYFSSPRDHRFAGGHPKVVVYGDSQAFDVYAALRNSPVLGVSYFDSPVECTRFTEAKAGEEPRWRQECPQRFAALLQSPQLRQADVLIYSHVWSPGSRGNEAYRRGVEELRRVNPGLRVEFWGPKPFLGEKWVSIREIMKHYDGQGSIDAYLQSMSRVDTGREAAKGAAAAAGVRYFDVAEAYCRDRCRYYEQGQFFYYDQVHWTEQGAAAFYEAFVRSGRAAGWQ